MMMMMRWCWCWCWWCTTCLFIFFVFFVLLRLRLQQATMTTVGYGDISAETNSEMAFSIVAMASGGIFYGYMIANISNLVNNKDQNDRRYMEKMNEIRAYMGARRVPKDLRRKMMSYYKHYFATKTALNESRILNDLPQGLQKAMRIHLAQDTLDRSAAAAAVFSGKTRSLMGGVGVAP